MNHLESKMDWVIVEEEWPDFTGRIFRDRPGNVIEILHNTVTRYPEVTGFVCDDQRLTFQTFARQVERVAAGLQAFGVEKGDRVSVLLGIGLEFPMAFFALMQLGAIVVPLNTRFKGEELAYEINDSESKVLIVDAAYWSSIDLVRDQLHSIQTIFINGRDTPEGVRSFQELRTYAQGGYGAIPLTETDDAVILYTSGTTGRPKGAILHHRGLIASAMHVCDFHEFGPEDKLLCCVPLFHVTGLAMVMLSHIMAGIPCVYMKSFSTKELLETLSSEKITQMISVINILWLLVNHADFHNYSNRLAQSKYTLLG
jgi:acyl-CoA synthetase (AMP-forming)/AMP-acid ligase II